MAKQGAQKICGIPGFLPGSPVLLHMENHWDNILWFWAVVLAHGLPVMSSPFSNNPESRERHIKGLSQLLQSPLCLTTNNLLSLFDTEHNLRVVTIEFLSHKWSDHHEIRRQNNINGKPSKEANAMLMLTSGSTGNAKAVQITHSQVLASVAGKASVRPLQRKPFLNWIGLDHVAGLVEIHLQALYLGFDQVHVQPADVVSSPTVFLDLLDRHRVCRTFAPNFFLAKLAAAIKACDTEGQQRDSAPWDLSNLVTLGSGGEVNDIDTCRAVTDIIIKSGGPHNAILPGFGMTETCAGVIYNTQCPEYEISHGFGVASLGTCMANVEMRLTLTPDPSEPMSFILSSDDTPGSLELRGSAVFNGYYRNTEATREAFSPDGWFRTGDTATIDANGYLHLVGRTKDVFNINGVKVPAADVQTSMERILDVLASRVICFPTRAPGAHTEQVTVVYVANEWLPQKLYPVHQELTQATLLCTGSAPAIIGLQDAGILPQTTLGKISRAKMRTMYETGQLSESWQEYNNLIHRARFENQHPYSISDIHPASGTEAILLGEFRRVISAPSQTTPIGPETPIYDIGFTSVDLVRLKHRIDRVFKTNVPLIDLMKNPTARCMAEVLGERIRSAKSITKTNHPEQRDPEDFDPVVVLRPEGRKLPLWLVHPGVGEVLVFVGLAQHLSADDRAVYALRARGFEPGHKPFATIAEMVKVYSEAIRSHQPHGPYLLAGYSYGAMVAFELAKVLQLQGERISFLASFNLPPHIAWRMRQLAWTPCLLHLGLFLGLVTESWLEETLAQEGTALKTRADAMACLSAGADMSRWEELGLHPQQLEKWADVAYSLQSLGTDYEPSGEIECLDVFHALPLKVAADSRKAWLENHLSRWQDFSTTMPRFHEVGGAHYTMLGPAYVAGFADILVRAMKARGV